jgi:hypothetical protein
LEFLLLHPGAGRRRFPQFTDLEGTRSWRVKSTIRQVLNLLSRPGRNAFH